MYKLKMGFIYVYERVYIVVLLIFVSIIFCGLDENYDL